MDHHTQHGQVVTRQQDERRAKAPKTAALYDELSERVYEGLSSLHEFGIWTLLDMLLERGIEIDEEREEEIRALLKEKP